MPRRKGIDNNSNNNSLELSKLLKQQNTIAKVFEWFIVVE
jgi:hypothetical protein